MKTHETILKPGENCQKVVQCGRGAFLIGGRDYFRAFREAVLMAEHTVTILAWDFNSEIMLERDAVNDGFPSRLGPFLLKCLEIHPTLTINILLWDFSMIYALEREWGVFSNGIKNQPTRLNLVKDDQLPQGASHHQKVVIVDDTLAFCGGLDLSIWRWDTREHRVHDGRRVDPYGASYGPYHDVQLMVTGEAAHALRDLCENRWKRATGNPLPGGDLKEPNPFWPSTFPVDFEDVRLGLSRTYSQYQSHEPVFEIEKLHLDLIESAKYYLYFENQYFSSHRITEALVKRLREETGPEVVVVMTQDTGGWLEENTMGALRDRLFERLVEADRFNRLRLYYPRAGGEGDSAQVYVHAKVVLADDRWVKIGSSNLSNRSMRVDSEVDLLLEESEPSEWIQRFKHRLFGVHFGMTEEQVRGFVRQNTRLIEPLESLMSEKRHSLALFRFSVQSEVHRRLTDSQVLDPDEPIDPAAFIQRTVPTEIRPNALRRLSMLSTLVLLGLIAALLVKLGWGLDVENTQSQLKELQGNPWSPLILVLLFFVSGLTGLPLNPILVACAVLFGPWLTLSAGLVGAHLSALTGFALGHFFGKPLVHSLGSNKIDKINETLRRRGLLSVALVRLIPVAPFVVINILAGATHLPFKSFHWGTLLGMLPGMTAIVLVTLQIESAIRSPDLNNGTGVVLTMTLLTAAFFFIRKSLRSLSPSGSAKGPQAKTAKSSKFDR